MDLIEFKKLNLECQLDNILEFLDTSNTTLLNQRLLIYIIKEDFTNALETYNSIKEPDEVTKRHYATLEKELSIKARDLSLKKQYDKALALLNSIDSDNIALLNQKMSLYTKIGDFKSASEIRNSIKEPNKRVEKSFATLDKKMSNKVKMLLHEKKYDDALDLLQYIQNASKELQKSLKREIEKLFLEDEIGYAFSLIELLDDSEYKRQFMSFNTYNEQTLTNTELNTLMTELYNDTLTWDEINDSNLEDYEIEALKMAYCEVYKLNYDARVLKDLKQKYQSDKKVLNILTKLLEHIKKKSFIVNFGFYEKLLSCNVLFEQTETQKLE